LELDFNNPEALGLTCAGSMLGSAQCPEFFTTGWRKHSYQPTGGVDGTGAVNMHWYTGMSIGFSPIWVEPVPFTRHFRVRYAVKQSAVLGGPGGIKLHRIRSNNHFIGTLESIKGDLKWYWEGWTGNAPVSAYSLGIKVPTDGRWHVYEFEVDYRNVSDLQFTFWLDGRFIKTVRRASTVGDMIAGEKTLIFSPFLEMLSCGNPSTCSALINKGDYTVDDFSYTPLP